MYRLVLAKRHILTLSISPYCCYVVVWVCWKCKVKGGKGLDLFSSKFFISNRALWFYMTI